MIPPRKIPVSSATFVIAVLYLVTGLVGIRWGLPTEERSLLYGRSVHQHVGEGSERLFVTGPLQSYQVDECSTLIPLSGMSPRRFDFDPRWFHWGSFYLYKVGAALALSDVLGLVTLTTDREYYLEHPDQLARIYLVGRVVTWLLGFGCVLLFMHLLSGITDSILIQLLFGLLLISSPLFFLYARYATPDIATVFWLLLTMRLSLFRRTETEMYSESNGHDKAKVRLSFAFLAAGLAASTKYYGVLALVFPVWRAYVDHRLIYWASRGAFFAMLGFIFGTPYAFLNWPLFWHDLHWQWNHIQAGHGDAFLGTAPSFIHHMAETFPAGVGALTSLLLGVSIIVAIVKYRRLVHPSILAAALLFWLQISRSPLKFSRYALPLLPIQFLIVAQISGWTEGRKWMKLFWIVILTLCAYTQISSTFDHISILRTVDIRDEAGVWFKRHAKTGDTVLFPGRPYFASPPISGDRFRIVIAPLTVETLTTLSPEWIVLSDYDTEPWLRAPEERPEETKALKIAVGKMVLDSGIAYEVKRFDRQLRIAGLGFRGERKLPHDLRYHCPEILICRRVEGGASFADSP